MLKDKNLNLRVTSKTMEELEETRVLLGGLHGSLSKAATVERAISVLNKLACIYWEDIVHFGSEYGEIAELVLDVKYIKPIEKSDLHLLVAEEPVEYNSSND